MKLVIVESPAKCDTIKRYLGENYLVLASLGHIRDLATSGKDGLGVDIANGFTPTYKINKDKRDVVSDLLRAKHQCDEVILATDPDREGEAIAWHLAQVLGLDVKKAKRLEFHEITRESITNALSTPRTINLNLVSSQETRRILDRIIGFRLSTLIQRSIGSRSAGRVQSATLKMIKEHDEEIASFVSEEYWNIKVSALINKKDYNLEFSGLNGKSIKINNESEANAILAQIPDILKISNVSKQIKTKESKEPFTTSSLQQEAFARLKFKTSKTQKVAQSLYEGINVGGEHMGLITYMRTDSTRLSPTFVNRATNYILETYGKEYLGHQKKIRDVSNMQDAHEAIRPTSNHRTPESVRQYLTNDQYELYKMIYNRALASLMKPKKEEIMTITFVGNGYTFKLDLTKTLFDGYTIILDDGNDKPNEQRFLNLKEGDEVSVSHKEGEQKFTQPPAHYSEARIVKLMEEEGIGRPSTYASTIETLRNRKYVNNNAGILTVTEQGTDTVNFLDSYFPDIVNVNYTAQMEEKLDAIQEGNESRLAILSDFNETFTEEISQAKEKILANKKEEEKTGEDCPECGSPLVYKRGNFGVFVGCSNYPKCRYIKNTDIIEELEEPEECPKCHKRLVRRTNANGLTLITCVDYPKCKYIKPEEKQKYTEKDYVGKCPEPDCDGYLVKKKGKFGYFLGCTNFPKCHHMENLRKKYRGKRK